MNNTQEVDLLKLRGRTEGKGDRELVPEVQGHEPGRVGPGFNPDYGHPFLAKKDSVHYFRVRILVE